MSKLLRRIKKRRNEMSNKNKPVIPMRVPNVGQPRQQQIDINDTAPQPCPKCMGQHFDIAIRLRLFSKLNPKNPSGQDALIKVEVYLCRACGHEYGQPIVQDNRVAPDKLKCNCEYNEPRSLTGYWVCDVHGQMKR